MSDPLDVDHAVAVSRPRPTSTTQAGHAIYDRRGDLLDRWRSALTNRDHDLVDRIVRESRANRPETDQGLEDAATPFR